MSPILKAILIITTDEMCLLCHFSIPLEKVIEDLESSINDPKYEIWNSTSISHLAISASGLDGPDAKTLSLRLLEGFISWGKQNADNKGIFPMTSLEVIEAQYKKALVEPVPENWMQQRDEIKAEIFHDDDVY